MQLEAGQAHVSRFGRFRQTRQDTLDLVGVRGLHLAAVAFFKQQFQAFVPEAQDHRDNCNLSPLIKQHQNC